MILYQNINTNKLLQISFNAVFSVSTFYHASLLWAWSNWNGLWRRHKPKRNTALEASIDCYILLLLFFVWHWKNLPANGKFELPSHAKKMRVFYYVSCIKCKFALFIRRTPTDSVDHWSFLLLRQLLRINLITEDLWRDELLQFSYQR